MIKRFIFRSIVLAGALLFSSELTAAASANVRVNSVGYIAAQPKRATVLTAAGNNAFNVRRVSDNASVFTGALGNAFTNTDTGQSVRFADFNAVTAAGDYYLDVTGVGTSVNFAIGPDVFNEALWVAVMGFYNQRCGMATSMTYDGHTWGHAACHMNDGNLTYYSGSNTTKNGTGGWHDAGDFGKYIVNAGITVGQMLSAWEIYGAQLQNLALPPATNPALPDYLEEIKWEMDWVLKMQFPDGRVSHKLTRTGFENYPLMPNADAFTRYYVPWGSAATASFVAMCTKASRAFQPYDAAYATTLQNAATLSYNYLVANPAEVVPDQACCGTGGYGSSDADDRLWAAVEMWQTTGVAAQLTDAETRINAHGADKSDFNWDWGDVSNLGMYTYALSTRTGRNATILADVRADIVADANTMVTNTNAHGYGRALNQYYWGANGTVVRQAHHLDIANRITPNAAFLDAAGQQLAWTFSRNYFNRSQVTGLGLNPPMAPHDRESSADTEANPKPGHLVGGGHPNANSWLDLETDYAQNEIAINWDGALTYALAMWYSSGPASTPTPTRTASPTPTPLPCGPTGALRRVNVGGIDFIDGAGALWEQDQAYTVGGWGYVAAGTASTTADPIAGTTDDELFQDQAWAANLQYRFTVPNGAYRVTVRLAETYWTAAGQRVFSIAAEGSTFFPAVDVFAAAPGADRAYELSLVVGVSDGVLDLSFAGSTDNASVAAILVENASSGPCATNTFTPTRTITSTATRTASPSATRTASPSATRTASPSATRTASPSSTPSVSASASPSPSATLTRTPTQTPSSTATRSATATLSASPSITETHTEVPVGSTDTYTPTVSPTYSATPTRTATATPTLSATPTLTATLTVTQSPSPSVSPSPSATPSPVNTPLPGDTATYTHSFTPTVSPSSTFTRTPTRSSTLTSTSTRTPSPAPTLTASPGPTATATPPPGATASPSPGDQGAPVVLEIVPVPQPVVGDWATLAVKMEGSADDLRLSLYSRAMVKVAVLQAPGYYGPGWNRATYLLPQLATGAYYIRLEALKGGVASKASKPGRLVILR